MQTQITPRRVIEEETEELGEIPLRRPPSLIYPLYLSPPSSYSNKVSQNRVLSSSPDPTTSSMLHLSSLSSSNVSQQHQNLIGHSQRVQ